MNIFKLYRDKIIDIIKSANKKDLIILPDNLNSINVDLPPKKFNCDLSTNVSMVLSKPNNKSPIEIAELISKLIKEDEERTKTILFISVNMIRKISILINPFLPFTSIKMQKMLNLDRKMFWEDLDLSFNSNHILNKPELLFRIIDDKEIESQILTSKVHNLGV